MMIERKKVLILGMARSGVAVAKLLAKFQNEIVITDLKEQEESLVKELQELGIKVVITKNQEELVSKDLDFVIKNPAISKNHLAVCKAREYSISVINEMEASFSFLPQSVQIVGITGSNGKTTTTTMIYELLKTTGKRVFLGGNIGIPFSSFVLDVLPGDIIVLEISDHQLCDMYQFKTTISVLTNLSPVHLDFHGDYETYLEMKKRIFQNHTKNELVILNKENLDVLKLAQDVSSKKLFFSSKSIADCYIENGKLLCFQEELFDLNAIPLKGVHNYENIMASVLVANYFGVLKENMFSFFKNFKGVEHRLEFVREVKKRKFYNDSKSTNNESTKIALQSFSASTILIMGGLDRGISFVPLKEYFQHVKAICCYGQTKEQIKSLAETCSIPCFSFESLEEATKKSYEISEENDVILLSPACASWDQFPNFEERGNCFKKIVKEIL